MSTNEVVDELKFSCLSTKKPIGKGPVADETGDEQPFDGFETVDSIVSDSIANKTDDGDWFSCSEIDAIGDEGLSGCSETDNPFEDWWTSLRGYGCSGFLLGRGGGISMDFTELELLLDSRTTYTTKVAKLIRKVGNQNCPGPLASSFMNNHLLERSSKTTHVHVMVENRY